MMYRTIMLLIIYCPLNKDHPYLNTVYFTMVYIGVNLYKIIIYDNFYSIFFIYIRIRDIDIL